MIKRGLTAFCIAVIAASYAHAGPWVRGYVVAFYDPNAARFSVRVVGGEWSLWPISHFAGHFVGHPL
jgi:hypothetical protein